MQSMKIVEEARKPLSMHPKKFALWLFMVSSGMLFAAWTSAYLVKRGEPGWTSFDLPFQFWVNTALIMASSVTMILGQRAVKANRAEQANVMLVITFLLGIAFLVGQVFAWQRMIEMNFYLAGMGSNTSSSFIYVLTGVHGFHIISGLVVLGILVFNVYRRKVHSGRALMVDLCASYWHFLDLLWLYLFVFLLLNR